MNVNAARNRTDPIDGKSVQGLYQEYGLFFTPGNNSIETGILRVNSYIERGKLKIYHTCVNIVREHLEYKFPELDIDEESKNLDERPIKANDHSCFIAGTLVETINGQVPIEDIKIGDDVLTRKGYRKVYDSALTGRNSEVYKVLTSDGKELVGTPNHPVWVKGKGFVRIDSLSYGDIIEVYDQITKERVTAPTNTVRQKPVHVSVVGLVKVEQRQDVYNISVEDAHEYYANGILVKNCDALRYLCMALPEDPEMLKADSFESPTNYTGVHVEDEWEWLKEYENDVFNGKDMLSYF